MSFYCPETVRDKAKMQECLRLQGKKNGPAIGSVNKDRCRE